MATHPGSSLARSLGGGGNRLCQNPDELAALRPAWDRLLADAGVHHPFLSWAWQYGWLRAHPRLRPRVLLEWLPDGRLAGLLPLRLQPHPLLPRLEWLAEGSGGDELDLVLSPDAHPETGPRLARHLLALEGWRLADLHSLPAASRLEACLQSTDLRCENSAEYDLPFLSLPAGFDQLLAQCSPNFRSEIRRRRRAWQRQWGSFHLECITSPPRLAEMLPELFRMHNLRRRQKSQPGIFESGALREFHLRLAADPPSGSRPRLYLLFAGDQPRAALYGFQTGDRFAFFQSGFDPESAALSPGTVLMSCILEDCIRRGERGFDFLRGDEHYKYRWTQQARSTYRLRLARSFPGKLAFRLPRQAGWPALGMTSKMASPPAPAASRSGRMPAAAARELPGGERPHDSGAPAPPQRHSLSYRLRAAGWFMQAAKNWPRIFAHKLLGWRLSECRFRNGMVIEFLSPQAELWQLGEIFRERVYEREFPDLPGDGWIVDLGANIGCFSLRAARALAAAGQVLAVEPNPACLHVLRRNLERNRAGNVQVLAAAVTARAGPRRLLLNVRSTDSRLEDAAGGGQVAAVEVEARTLEQILAGLTRVELLKMDIEGEEFAVIWQTPRRVWRNVQRLALEYHRAASDARPPAQLLQRLEWLGYDIRRHYAPEAHVGYVLAQRRCEVSKGD